MSEILVHCGIPVNEDHNLEAITFTSCVCWHETPRGGGWTKYVEVTSVHKGKVQRLHSWLLLKFLTIQSRKVLEGELSPKVGGYSTFLFIDVLNASIHGGMWELSFNIG